MMTYLIKRCGFTYLTIIVWCFSFYALLFSPVHSSAETFNGLGKFIKNKDAVVVAGPTGTILFSKNGDQKLIPASTLKILTALVALNYLGADYRFRTECYLDHQSNLTIKGYGDPLIVSEVITGIAKTLARDVKTINDIILDDTYFDQPLTIPGVTESSQPYDAPNGALCANFNTVNFERTRQGRFISAEPQTPLLPFAIKRIRSSNVSNGRIVLTHKNKEATLYVGHLLAYFLNSENVPCQGTIKTGTVDPARDRLIFTYVSPYTVEQLISELMEYSNNFTANQLLISSGAAAFGPPGTLKKGIQAVHSYVRHELHIDDMDIIEGSGISRENRTSANQMMKILLKFKPYSALMRYEKNEYYKTGTLKGIRTRAGYIENKNGELYPFVVLVNTPGKTTGPIMKHITNSLLK